MMAAKKRKAGYEVVFVDAPADLKARLAAVAERNRRSLNGEAIVAFERHVRAEEARIRAEMAAETQPLPRPTPADAPAPKRGRQKGGA